MGTQNLSNFSADVLQKAETHRIALVVAQWNNDITENLYQAAYKTLVSYGILEKNIKRFEVPGAFELVYAASRITREYPRDVVFGFQAIIVIGSVIQGDTRHFEFVCQGVTQGITSINQKQDTPVIFCVLTDQNKQQAIDRSGGKHGNKGVECAVSAIKMIQFNQQI